ncbi:MAG: hypothetical protein IJH12_02115 [Clostridia bacterium]|nr:hypothetical protein [Clostridia bacterium]
MALSPYFTDEELISQIRLQFDYEDMWDIDFTTIFQTIEDIGDYFSLNFRNRCFRIDKITGIVIEVES